MSWDAFSCWILAQVTFKRGVLRLEDIDTYPMNLRVTSSRKLPLKNVVIAQISEGLASQEKEADGKQQP